MINKISLKSLKSFIEKDITSRKLTLLSGLNNSGKSTVIQALRMYTEAAHGNHPLLEGHGALKEIRSKLSSSRENVEVTLCFSDGQSDSLVLTENTTEKPSRCPEVIFVGAHRLGPQAFLPTNQSLEEYPKVGDQGEYVFDFIEKFSDCIIPKELLHKASQGNTFEYVLRGWLSEIAPGIEFNSSVISKADITHAEFNSFRPTNVGFGLSYTLPIIAGILASASKAPTAGWINSWGTSRDKTISTYGCLLILENPEAHLHPQGQTAIGRMIALAISCGVQVVVETHSDHLMDGIRIAVKEGLCDENDVIFHYFSKTKDGATKIDTPLLNKNGKLEHWPEGFFDQTLKNRAILAKRT